MSSEISGNKFQEIYSSLSRNFKKFLNYLCKSPDSKSSIRKWCCKISMFLTNNYTDIYALTLCTMFRKNNLLLHCVSKKVPTFKLSITLSNLTYFQNFCTAGKRTKFATKVIRHSPPHLRDVATLPWEIKNSNFLQIFSRYGRKCKQVAFLSPLALLLIHNF